MGLLRKHAPVLKQIWQFLYPLIVALIVTYSNAYIYHTGPFEPPGPEISYNVERYIREPNGSYMQGICVWNSGSKDISNLNLLYSFESYISNEVLDKDFTISNRLANASPVIGPGDIHKRNNATNLIEIGYSFLPKGEHFREQFYINKPYPVTVKSMTPDVGLMHGSSSCDPCICL